MNKRLLIGLGITIIAVAVWLTTKDQPITNLPNPGTTIVAFGDSLVQGVGSTDGNDFVNVLSERIGKPIINMGESGDTTAAALERIESVIEPNPKIVIVLLGGNDYLRRVPADQTFANLQKIVDRIHQSGSAVLLLGVRGGLVRDTYNARFEEFAKTNKVGFVPNVLDGLIGDKKYMFDQIHPNDAGYDIIADKVEPVLKKMLNTHLPGY